MILQNIFPMKRKTAEGGGRKEIDSGEVNFAFHLSEVDKIKNYSSTDSRCEGTMTFPFSLAGRRASGRSSTPDKNS